MNFIKPDKLFSNTIVLCIACIPLVHLSSLADPTLLSRQIYLTGFQILLFIPAIYQINKTSFLLSKAFAIIITAWLLAAGTSILYAKNLAEAWYSFSKFCLLFSSLFLIHQALTKGWLNLHIISKGIAAASMISVFLWLKEIIEKTTPEKSLWAQKNLYELQTAFGHKNLYSSFILLCLPFVFYLFMHAKKVYKYFWIAWILILICSILFTQTKSVLLGLFVALFIAISYSIFNIKQGNKIKLISFIGAYIVTFTSIIVFIYLYPEYFTLIVNNDTIRERILLWENTWNMIKEHFPLGVGLGNWQVYFPKYGLTKFLVTNYHISDGYTTFQRPHNDFLWILSEAGLFGFLSYLAFISYSIYKGFLGLKAQTNNKDTMVFSAFLITSLAFIVVSLVDFPMERNEHQFLWATICCVLIGSNRKNERQIKAKPIFIMAILALGFSLYFGVNRLKQETHSKKLIMAHSQQNWGVLLREANKINPAFLTIDNFSIPVKWYQGIAYFATNELEKAKDCFTKAYYITPYQIHVINNLASIFEKEGNHLEALKYYDELLAISPKQPDALLNKSAVLYNMNRIDEAMECLYKFVYDEKNDQFLLYLNTIGKSFIKSKNLGPTTSDNLTAEYIQKFFIYNQRNKNTFEELKSCPNE